MLCFCPVLWARRRRLTTPSSCLHHRLLSSPLLFFPPARPRGARRAARALCGSTAGAEITRNHFLPWRSLALRGLDGSGTTLAFLYVGTPTTVRMAHCGDQCGAAPFALSGRRHLASVASCGWTAGAFFTGAAVGTVHSIFIFSVAMAQPCTARVKRDIAQCCLSCCGKSDTL